MRYEYKELIKTYTEYIMDDYEVVDYIEAGKELNHVYAQAAKADEYEAKAEAWDRLSVSIRECNKENEVKSGLDAIVRTSKKGQIVQRHIDWFESGESE